MTRIALLGATGSIGRQALEVIDANDDLELVAATSGSTPIDGLAPLTQVGGDPTSLLERAQPDVVLNATLGFAGLPATMWALEHGVTLALANKESLVAAGELALAARARGGGLLIPVDSEHSALFQCAQLGEPESVVLTASGGPFRGRTRDELADVTAEQALAHPTWNMGAKITIDSATLANKGLEVIEAHFLFGLPYERIEVLVHPTSIVHGLVRFRDGAAIAHLGYPDMRVPISYALTYPRRAATPVPRARPDRRAARVLRARPRDVPAARAGARGGGEGRHVSVRLQRGERGRRRRVPRGPDRLPRHRRARRGRARRASTARPRATSTSWARPTGAPASWWSRYGSDRRDRRAGGARDDPRGRPLLRRARRRDDAAEVLHRLRAADRQDDARQGRVRHRLDPARRLREDPGHEPAVAGRPDRGAAAGGARAARGPSWRGSTTRSSARTGPRRTPSCRSFVRRSARRGCGRSSSGRSRPTRTGARRPGGG